MWTVGPICEHKPLYDSLSNFNTEIYRSYICTKVRNTYYFIIIKYKENDK